MKKSLCLFTLNQTGIDELIAWIQGSDSTAARGRLVHRVDIDDRGMIQRYQILAPTEWNFHPRGIVRKGLENLQGRNDEELDQLAKIFINAVDPCVGYSLSIH